MRYFIRISYDGTAYHGWQIQENSVTVQSLLEEALRFRAGLTGSVTGCGRTDAGVHAREFYAHFDLDKVPGELDPDELRSRLNSYLPDDIAVQRIFPVLPGTHSRFHAVYRTYKYYISRVKDPFARAYSWYYHAPLDTSAMQQAADVLHEYSDFTSFSKLHSNAKTNNCTISYAGWEEKDGRMTFTITADRFLRNMVRAIVGTLVQAGKGKLTTEGFRRVIESKNRSNAGVSAPAHGLFLHEIGYKWDEILVEGKG